MWRKRARSYWRHLALAGAAVGLALAPLGPARPLDEVLPALLALGGMAVLLVVRPPDGSSGWVHVGLLALVAAGIGLGAGSARLHAIDGGALRAPPELDVRVTGVLTAPPRRQVEGTALELEAPDGRILV